MSGSMLDVKQIRLRVLDSHRRAARTRGNTLAGWVFSLA